MTNEEINNDGGPAFPQVNYARPADGYGASIMEIRGGMSLRDWFAGMALAGLMVDYYAHPNDTNKCAEIAYVAADAMLVERNRKEDEK